MSKFKYYKSELSKIDASGQYPPTLQIRDGNKDEKTKWMSLNRESALELIKWLSDTYILPKMNNKSLNP